MSSAASPFAWLRPARTVPVTRWRCEGRWRPTPLSLPILLFGLYLFGTGEALMIQSTLGVSPWTVLAQGVSLKTGLGIGWATFVLSVIVLLLWIPIKERPGLGTIANAVVIATALQIGVNILPAPEPLWQRVAFVLVGIAMIGIGSGFYLTTNLGPGPRDGWMTGLHQITGIRVSRVRLAIEITVMTLGWLLGGTVGVGTLLFALLIGPSVAYGLQIAGSIGRDPNAPQGMPTAVSDDEFPELDA